MAGWLEPLRSDTLPATTASSLGLCTGLGRSVLPTPCEVVVLGIEEELACCAVLSPVFDDHSMVLALGLAAGRMVGLAPEAVWLGHYDEHGRFGLRSSALVCLIYDLGLPAYIVTLLFNIFSLLFGGVLHAWYEQASE
jgi:hypothetical protein